LLDIWQLNNVEFKQGIVLREALRTMRNSPASYKQAVPFRETYGWLGEIRRCARLDRLRGAFVTEDREEYEKKWENGKFCDSGHGRSSG
jgi:hypothetical protein